jgi:hypothetical protein
MTQPIAVLGQIRVKSSEARLFGTSFVRQKTYASTVGCRNAILVVMANNLYCSFCNQPEDQTGPLLAKMEAGPKRHPVRICKGCAEMAIDTIDREVLRRAAEQPRLRVS